MSPRCPVRGQEPTSKCLLRTLKGQNETSKRHDRHIFGHNVRVFLCRDRRAGDQLRRLGGLPRPPLLPRPGRGPVERRHALGHPYPGPRPRPRRPRPRAGLPCDPRRSRRRGVSSARVCRRTSSTVPCLELLGQRRRLQGHRRHRHRRGTKHRSACEVPARQQRLGAGATAMGRVRPCHQHAADPVDLFRRHARDQTSRKLRHRPHRARW